MKRTLTAQMRFINMLEIKITKHIKNMESLIRLCTKEGYEKESLDAFLKPINEQLDSYAEQCLRKKTN